MRRTVFDCVAGDHRDVRAASRLPLAPSAYFYIAASPLRRATESPLADTPLLVSDVQGS